MLFFDLGLDNVISGTRLGVFEPAVGVLAGDISFTVLEGLWVSPSRFFLASSSIPTGFSCNTILHYISLMLVIQTDILKGTVNILTLQNAQFQNSYWTVHFHTVYCCYKLNLTPFPPLFNCVLYTSFQPSLLLLNLFPCIMFQFLISLLIAFSNSYHYLLK